MKVIETEIAGMKIIETDVFGDVMGWFCEAYNVEQSRKLSLKSAYFMKGHDAYRFTHGFNLVGLACIVIAFATCMLFVFNPLSGAVKSSLFTVLTGSGYTAICGGLLYYLASLSPLKKYMLKDRDDLEIT